MKSPNITQNNFTKPIDETVIDLQALWDTFKKYSFRILLLTLIVGLVAIQYSRSLKSLYSATATLVIETKQNQLVNINELYKSDIRSREFFYSQIEKIKSEVIIEKVITRLNLKTHPEFQPTKKRSTFWHKWLQSLPRVLFSADTPIPKKTSPSLPKQDEIFFRQIADSIKIENINQARMIKVSFDAHDPKLAANVANAITEVYIENERELRLQSIKQGMSWLTVRLKEISLNLTKSEQALEDYAEQQNVVGIKDKKHIMLDQLNKIASALLKVGREKIELTIIFKRINSLKKKSIKELEKLPSISLNSQVQDLKEKQTAAQRKIFILEKRYGTKHPKMIVAQSELEALQDALELQIQQIVVNLKNKYEFADENVRALTESMKQIEVQILDLNRKEAHINVLKREINSNQQLYDIFLTRFKETSAIQDNETNIAQVVNPARVPIYPYKPNKKLIVATAVIMAFMVGLMLAIVLEYMDKTLKGTNDVRQNLNLPLLGRLPKLKISKKKPFRLQYIFFTEDISPFNEAIRSIRTHIILFLGINAPNQHQVLLVTSSKAREGKTTFSVNQAFSQGNIHKTLLIDADLRHPSVAPIFGLSPEAPGLSELVAGTNTISECVHHFEGINIDILPSGVLPGSPLDLLFSNNFQKILTTLQKHYQYIVIDSPPTLNVTDSLVLSQYASGLVFVINSSTAYPIVQKEIKRLHQVQASILGVVLNQIDPKQ